MAKKVKGMKPIWYFVGLILMIMGGVIALSGLYYIFYPSQSATVMQELHPNLWWGGIMFTAGFIFFWRNRRVRLE
ncbi:hypothetical protein KGY73_09570 [bacterium]|nr:hypothetical protein [bacterium]